MTQETDVEFLKRMMDDYGEESYAEIKWPDFDRLIALAERGAAVPDEPTHVMTIAGQVFPSKLFEQSVSSGQEIVEVARNTYRAMLQAALKDTP